ncbi:unnamed protein product [Aphanomyces euteiches]
MRRQHLLVAVVAVCALFSVHGALLKDTKTRHLDAMYADGKAADGCVWKRVWRGDTADLAVSDELPFVKRNVKMAKGPTFGLQTSSGENGTVVSGRASFPLDLDSFPTAGKLVMSATLPRAQGLRPLVRLVKTRSDGHQDELIVIEGSSTSQSGLALRSSGSTKELPCIKGLSQGFHEYVVAWDASWVRWYVDGNVYVETHVSSFFTSHDATISLSLVAELQIDATYSHPSAQMNVRELLLYKQTSDACVPTLFNPLQCNQTSNEPLIPSLRSGSLLGSLTLDELHDFIDDALPELMAPFPHLWRKEIIGQTVEDRPIVALCFGVCHLSADETVPQALYTGLHHSREPMSMMNLVFFIDHLILGLTAQNAAITQLLHARQLWFVLVVNPDGYVYNEQTIANSGTLAESFNGQRKNRNGAKCRSDPQLGVDLNRNYDVCFDQDSVGSSNKGCAEDYRGASAFSEPETMAIRRLVEKNAFSAALNYHSFGQYFNIPFACQPKGTPDSFSSDVYTMLATEMTSLNHFKYGQSWKESNLYSVNGEASDWMWNAHGIYAMSPEVGPEFHLSTLRGFWPSDSAKIHTICEELLHSNYVLAAYSGPLYHVEMERWESMDKNGVRLHLLVSNRGLRRPKGLEAVASIHMNGTASGPVETVDILSASDPNNDVVSVVVAVPNADTLAFVVLRDGFSCYMYRVSLGKDPSVFQMWQPLLQPQCGACATFGAPSSINPGLNCSLIDAVTVEEDDPMEKTLESHQDSLRASSKHKAPLDENKALLLISLVVLLGMVVALIGMRHAKQSNSSAEDYAMVAKTERDAVEQDNMLPLDSPMVGPIQGIDDEESLLHGDGSASQLRVRSPPPPTQYPSSEEV